MLLEQFEQLVCYAAGLWAISRHSRGKEGLDALKPTFNIQGADIECTDDVKLLGVTIDYRMNFDKHISKKAARQIKVLLRRIGKYMPINCRKVIYQAFILSAFNFCPVIWHLFLWRSKHQQTRKAKLQSTATCLQRLCKWLWRNNNKRQINPAPTQ